MSAKFVHNSKCKYYLKYIVTEKTELYLHMALKSCLTKVAQRTANIFFLLLDMNMVMKLVMQTRKMVYDCHHIISVSGVDEMLNMKIGDVIKLVDVSGVDEKQMTELVEDLREAFKQWVIYDHQHMSYNIFTNLIIRNCQL